MRCLPQVIRPGTRFGRLTILMLGCGSKNSGALAVCACTCGKVRNARAVDLRRGKVVSCGGAHPCSVCGAMLRHHSDHMRKKHVFSLARSQWRAA